MEMEMRVSAVEQQVPPRALNRSADSRLSRDDNLLSQHGSFVVIEKILSIGRNYAIGVKLRERLAK
jgi:hypothetical protein